LLYYGSLIKSPHF